MYVYMYMYMYGNTLYQSNVLYSQLSVSRFRDKAKPIRNEYTPV